GAGLTAAGARQPVADGEREARGADPGDRHPVAIVERELWRGAARARQSVAAAEHAARAPRRGDRYAADPDADDRRRARRTAQGAADHSARDGRGARPAERSGRCGAQSRGAQETVIGVAGSLDPGATASVASCQSGRNRADVRATLREGESY